MMTSDAILVAMAFWLVSMAILLVSVTLWLVAVSRILYWHKIRNHKESDNE
jgi:hypothetical protein